MNPNSIIPTTHSSQPHTSAKPAQGDAAGRGVEKDPVEAYKWYSLAITNGYTKAKPRKDTLAKKMTPNQITKAEALAKEMIEQNPKLIRKK